MGHLKNLLIDSKCSIFVLWHLDFLDFLQKKLYSIDHQSNISSENLRRDMAIIWKYIPILFFLYNLTSDIYFRIHKCPLLVQV